MTTFILFALLGVAVVGIWVWSRRFRRERVRFVSESLPVTLPLSTQQNPVEQCKEAVASSAQTLEIAKQLDAVVSSEATGSSVVAAPSESRSDSTCTQPDNNVPEQAAESTLADSQPKAATVAQPTPVAETPPLLPQPIEAQIFTLTENVAAQIQRVPAEADIGQGISAKPFADIEEKHFAPSTSVPTESNATEVEHIVVPVNDTLAVTIPSEPSSEAKENSHSLAVQIDTVTKSPPKPALPPVFENDQPSVNALPQQPSETAKSTKVPDYRPLAPPSPKAPPRPDRPSTPRPSPNTNADLRLRVQLVFDRRGGVRTLALVPDRRDGMPGELEINGTQGELHITEWNDDRYEPVALTDPGKMLRQGVEWRGHSEARRWRWILSGRELYVFTPGEEFGLAGFVTAARLRLNACQAVLATTHLRNEVLTALAETGCVTPEVNDDTLPGVPSGWLLFRDVTPTRAVPMRDETNILNALCPLSDIEPHFVGGIRLERRTWLAGFPPRIRFTGALGDDFRPMIDDQPAQLATDSAFEAPGWNSTGEHRLWFGDQTETYSVRMMDESWEPWRAHDFGASTSICGGMTHPLADVQPQQVQVPVTSPLLLGARPGEIFRCHPHSNVHGETVRTLVPFAPVWALPVNPSHADKRSARILLLQPMEPVTDIQLPRGNRVTRRALIAWISAIRQAGRKGLVLAVEGEESKALWRRYRNAAKQLRKKMR